MARGRITRVDTGAAEAVPGVQKFVIDCNWKFAADNPFDWYHPQITHMSALRLGLFPTSPDVVTDSGGAQSTLGEDLTLTVSVVDGRDEIVLVSEYGHGIAGPTARNSRLIGDPSDHAWRERPEVVETLGPIGVEVAGHPNIFPNSWLTNFQLSLRIPISPSKTEVWWFSFVEKDASPAARAATITRSNRVFGPSGLLEQDDGENWNEIQKVLKGWMARQRPFNTGMGVGHARIDADGLPGRTSYGFTEEAARHFYQRWVNLLQAKTWNHLDELTRTDPHLPAAQGV